MVEVEGAPRAAGDTTEQPAQASSTEMSRASALLQATTEPPTHAGEVEVEESTADGDELSFEPRASDEDAALEAGTMYPSREKEEGELSSIGSSEEIPDASRSETGTDQPLERPEASARTTMSAVITTVSTTTMRDQQIDLELEKLRPKDSWLKTVPSVPLRVPGEEYYKSLPFKIAVQLPGQPKPVRLRPILRHHMEALGTGENSEMGKYVADISDLWKVAKECRDDHISERTKGMQLGIGMYFERQLAFAFSMSLLARTKIVRLMFLRELWLIHGGCRAGDKCCLGWDISNPDFSTFQGSCRHWEYYSKQRVYIDKVVDEEDYRLTFALVAHAFASWELENHANSTRMMNKKQGPRKSKRQQEQGVDYGYFEVLGFGPTVKVVAESNRMWYNDKRNDHWRYLMGASTVLFLDYPPVNGGVYLGPWIYGHMCDTAGNIQGEGIITAHEDKWILLVTKAKDTVRRSLCERKSRDPRSGIVREWTALRWRPVTSLLNYFRRFQATWSTLGYDMVKRMAARDFSWSPRPHEEYAAAYEKADTLPQRLDHQQDAIVDHALQYTGIVVCRGPFGCGKTRTITALVESLRLGYPNERIAVVSETNAAIDEDLARLCENGYVDRNDLLRVGELREGMEKYSDVYLNTKLEDKRQELVAEGMPKDDIKLELRDYERDVIASAKVVVTTLAHMGSRKLLFENFDTVINDEGGQTVEPALLQSIRRGTKLLVIVGDDNQLRGSTPLDLTQQDTFPGEKRRHRLTWALLHQLHYAFLVKQARQASPRSFDKTTQVYRSQPQITQWLGAFYEYDLVAAKRVNPDYLQSMVLPNTVSSVVGCSPDTSKQDGDSQTLEKIHVLWFGSENEERRSPEDFNHVEACMDVELLMRIRATLAAQDMKQKTVFVVTPYTAQKELIKSEFNKIKNLYEEHFEVMVETTDSSQGREADIVIVSMVRTHTPGFLRGYPARSLVSLSRARDYLFVLASWDLLQHEPSWDLLHKRAELLEIKYRKIGWDTAAALRAINDTNLWKKIGQVEEASAEETEAL